MPLNTGQVVEDRYRIAKLLGQGGMGAVYRAWDMRLNRPVALKEMVPQSSLDLTMLAQLRQQFQQEAQVLATLTHPSLVRVTDYFSWNNNEYLVMDFVEGESLAERIAREGAQPEAQVIAWSGQLLDALAYCHGRGVLHRDIKPQNIVITPEGQAVLVDFGLVKLWDPRDPHTRTVMRGAGTPEYAPPEQYDIGAGHTDPRSDIYGLGATIYHALTGQAPRTATQRMASPSSFIPPRRINAAISEATEAVVLKALEMAMEQRYQSTDDMARALGIAPRPSPIAPRRAAPERKHRQVMPAAKPERKPGALLGLGGVGLAIVGVLCLVLAAGTVVIGWILWEGGKPLPPTATPALQPTTTRFPTSTPRPTNTPEPAIGGLLLRDDFSNSGSGWEVGDYDFGSVGYGPGYYYVISSEAGQMMWGLASQNFSDLTIGVDATQVSGPSNNNNAYGVICRVQPNDDGYILRISGDGYYAIHRVVGGEFEPLVDWTTSDAIRQGNATNQITAICEGTHLALFIEGELLAEADDDTFSQGDIALTATTYETEPTEIHFKNLTVLYTP